MGGGGGMESPLPPYTHPNTFTAAAKLMHIKLKVQNTEYIIQKPIYIKLPMYLFFYMALGLDDFDVGKSITRANGRDCHFRAQMSQFSGPTLFNGHRNGFSHIKIITSYSV